MMRTITIGSITHAQKARRALASRGIRARLVKSDSTSDGCAYGIELEGGDHLKAIAILRELGIPHRDYDLF